MKKYVVIEAYAQGYHSGAEYNEVIYLPCDTYKKLKDGMEDKFFAGELDGKHSEVYGSVNVKIVSESEFKTNSVKFTDDEKYLDDIWSVMDEKGLELDIYSIASETREHLNSLYEYKTIEITFKRKHEEEIMQFLDSLS